MVHGSKNSARTFRSTVFSPNSLDVKLDKYLVEDNPEFSKTQLDFVMRYAQPKKYKVSPRTEILAMPKPQYQGKDFFQRNEFRGLFLADHQEAIGLKAFKYVDKLNDTTVSKFSSIETFRDSITAKKTQENFYKKETKLKNSLA